MTLSRYALLALVVIHAGVNAGCLAIHHRGPPKRLEVSKQVDRGELFATAERLERDVVELHVLEERRAQLERRVVYGTITHRIDSKWWIEIVEIPFALASTPMLAMFLVAFDLEPPPSHVRTMENFETGFLFAGINPTESWLGMSYTTQVSDEELFFGDPVSIDHTMRVPLVGVEVTYRFLDAKGSSLSAATGRPDDFGLIVVQDVPPEATAVRLRTAEGTTTVPLPAARPPREAPSDDASANAATPASAAEQQQQ